MKKLLKLTPLFLVLSGAYSSTYAFDEGATLDEVSKVVKDNQLQRFQKTLIGLKIRIDSSHYFTCAGVALNPTTILTSAFCLMKPGSVNQANTLDNIRTYVVDAIPNKKQGRKLELNGLDGVVILANDYNIEDRKQPNNYSLGIIRLNQNLPRDKLIPLDNTLSGQGIAVNGNEVRPGQIKNPQDIINIKTKLKNINPVIYNLGWTKYTETTFNKGEAIYNAGSGLCATLLIPLIAPRDLQNHFRLDLEYRDFAYNSNTPLCYANTGRGALIDGDLGGPLFEQTGPKEFELIGVLVNETLHAPVYALLTDNNQAWNSLKDIAFSSEYH